VLADLAKGRLRAAGRHADLSMGLAGRFTEHHALLCRLHRDRITVFDQAIAGLDEQLRGQRLVRRFGGQKNPGAKKKAITAIAHTLLKIAYQVLKSGKPYQELGADFCTRRESVPPRRACARAFSGSRMVLCFRAWPLPYRGRSLDGILGRL
jgi:hypothetical protein